MGAFHVIVCIYKVLNSLRHGCRKNDYFTGPDNLLLLIIHQLPTPILGIPNIYSF